MLDCLDKAIAIAAIAFVSAGCTIGRLHVDVIDMNEVKTPAFDEAPTKPAAQVDFKWDF